MKRTVLLLGAICLLLAVVVGRASSSASSDQSATPDAFAFTAVCGQPPGILVESDSITVTGIADPVPVTVVNGEYSINGGPYTAEPGTVAYGQTVAVRHTTATGDDTTTSTLLTVGGRSAPFTSSTGPCLRGTN